MRTTLNIDEQLLSELKRIAAGSHRSLSAVVQDALREALARRGAVSGRPPVKLPAFGGTGVQAGLDLDQSSAVLDLLDEADGVHDRYRPKG